MAEDPVCDVHPLPSVDSIRKPEMDAVAGRRDVLGTFGLLRDYLTLTD